MGPIVAPRAAVGYGAAQGERNRQVGVWRGPCRARLLRLYSGKWSSCLEMARKILPAFLHSCSADSSMWRMEIDS